MTNDTKKVNFLNSIKFKVLLVVVVAIVITFIAVELPLLANSRKNLTSTNGNYLLDMAELTGKLLDRELVTNAETAMDYDALDTIFNGVGLEGISSSYAYVVSPEGTMLYHPTKDKVGNAVENDCVKQVVSDIASGKAQPGKSEFVEYLYKGAVKYAAYKISSNSSIVVVTADEKEIMALQSKAVATGSAIGVVILVVLSLVAYSVANLIVKPIASVTDVIAKAGDLDFVVQDGFDKLTVRKDETGVMAKAVSMMQEKMVDIISALKREGDTLNEASSQLSTVAVETSNTIEQVDKAVSEIADGAGSQAEETQKATESVILMGNMVEETNREVEHLSDTANVMKESGKVASKTLSELEAINVKAKESIDVIYEQTNTTNSSANKIREATAIITSIAEETNLLSLNASIEAARAGEQGRGFAVVASQIQKLAEQSNESARTIEEIIDSLIKDSEKSVETMDTVLKIMDEQVEKVEKTVETFSQLSEGITTSIDGIGNIADKTRKLDEARITVVDVVQNLTAIAEENAASTEETSASVTEVTNFVYNISENANKLDAVANELQEKVNLFNI